MQTKINFGLLAMLLIFCSSWVISPNFSSNKMPSKTWKKLGAKKISFRTDKVEILTNRQEGLFSAIRIKAKKQTIGIHKIAIHFGNGQKHNTIISKDITEGKTTKVIPFPNNKKQAIKKVVIWYNSKLISAKDGQVEILGTR